jgi:PAS domain S-box-containing protein
MRIQYANPSMERVFGYTPAEVEGRDISILQPLDLREAHRRAMAHYLRTGERSVDWRATEIRGLHRDGHEFPAEIGFSQLEIGGVPVFAAFIRDIAERKRAQAALESANRRLKVLSDRVLAVQEEERRYISSELHDDVGQSLLALQLGMHRLGESRGKGAERLLEECVEIVAGVQEKLRQLSVRLHPPQLAQLGLQEAVAALVSRQRATTGLDIRCRCEGPEPGLLGPELETAAYRICQEALSNATRHSGAQRVEVRTKLEADRFCLSVSDDGRGFDAGIRGEAASESGRMGLISMEERARLAGGSLELVTAPGAGTVVIAMFPRPKREAAVPAP